MLFPHSNKGQVCGDGGIVMCLFLFVLSFRFLLPFGGEII